MITRCVQNSRKQVADTSKDCFEKFQDEYYEKVQENLKNAKDFTPESLKDHFRSKDRKNGSSIKLKTNWLEE